MMAPTEVLAEQHFLNVRRLLGGAEHSLENPDWFAAALDGGERPVTVALLTGSTRTRPRREILRMAAEGTLDLLIGTHALIQEQVALPNLALAVGDEQHRFGRPPARGTARQERRRRTAPAPHVRHAYTPHARAHALRRPRDIHHARTSGRPPGDPDAQRRPRARPRRRELPADAGARGPPVLHRLSPHRRHGRSLQRR